MQELIKLHGGSIAVESTDGKGTTFIVSLPLGSANLPPKQIDVIRTVASTGTGASPYVEEALLWVTDDSSEATAEPGGVTREQASSPISARHSRSITPADPPRVLLADDNADIRQYVARLLAEQYCVEAVSDGEAALAMARERVPDLVLTDVMMPRLDGFGLLSSLRSDPRTRGVPVIMLSARAETACNC